MSFLSDKDAWREWHSRRAVDLLLAGAFFVLTELGRFRYRPWAYANHVNDFGLADSIGNLGGILVQIFFICAVINPRGVQRYRVVAFLVAGYILYEIAQPWLPRGVFDWKDIVGTVVGGGIGAMILWRVRD